MGKTKKSLAEQLAELSTTAPKDYDPEDIGGDSLNSKFNDDSDMGSDGDGDDKVHTGREHYVSVGKSQLRSKIFLMDDPKYKGKKSSRREALEMNGHDDEDQNEDEDGKEDNEEEDDDEEDDDEDEEMASDDLDDGEDLMTGFDRDGSDHDDDIEGEYQEENDSEAVDDESDEDDEGGYGDLTRSDITETTQEMQEELQKIQQEEKELLNSMTKSVSDDVEKGIHVKAQMSLWETLLDTRIRLQKSVSLINTFPQPSIYDEFLTDESAEPLEEAKHNLRSFIDTLITVRTSLLRNIPDVKIPKSNKRQLSDLQDDEARNLDDDAWQSKAWKDMEALEDGWRSYRNNTLEKWSNKVQIASGIPLNKKFKAMNQGIMTQISQTMADKERLVKRTQLKRSEYHILGAAPEAEEHDKNDTAEKTPEVSKLDAHLSNHDQEIFDDTDFYQQLLRELIESRMVDNDDPTAMGMRWAALRQTKQTKKQVDTKGSKGRRLRYHVHEKLQSFMVPIPAGTWHGEMVEELFSSLLGRKAGNLNDDDDENDEDAHAEQEQEDVVDDGLRIFG
ncbi:apoptosis-antagonizing transcription factor [Gamsiella multidivaricata]|uniref:apoptosis-antagonizing transcription factor n=1 Tax=Gamsiella multidivaricata TaxID=101098 RepID=UPI00221FF713|nr:apoptosis-antagonizing transcription factor [Gamsiella multidivaricata]KAG0357677.1 hypothetical protein BGZ54_000229 [Gamsiella multidivaricata]KAI7817595.1 apoptosis-antagonizing transcription factor [Gamsiella multidivaricata]